MRPFYFMAVIGIENYWLKECKAPAGQTRRG